MRIPEHSIPWFRPLVSIDKRKSSCGDICGGSSAWQSIWLPYWHIICTDDNGIDTELEENAVYAIYNSVGDSLRILENGKIEVGFSEDGMQSALSDGKGYH